MKVELINRSATPASLKFSLSARAEKPGRIMAAAPAPEFQVIGVCGIVKAPFEVFLYEPVRLEPKTHVIGTLWFIFDKVQDEDDVPMERFDVGDVISGESWGVDLSPDFRTKAARNDFNGHPVLFVRC